jgi:hypothetical protein
LSRINQIRAHRSSLIAEPNGRFVEILDYLLPRIPLVVTQFENQKFDFRQQQWGGLNMLYRARIIEDDRIPYRTIKELSYIPKEDAHKIVKFGRVNKPRESMFYASTSELAACAETFTKGNMLKKFQANKKLFIAVSIWKVKKPFSFVEMACTVEYFGSFLDKLNNSEFHKLSVKDVKRKNERLRSFIESPIDKEIFDFFSDEFSIMTDDDQDHKFSNYFADRVFNRSPKFQLDTSIDCIWYPSVPTGYQETNIVMPPERVDDILECTGGVIYWVVNHSSSGQTEFIPLDTYAPLNENQEFDWKFKKL